MVDFGGIRIKDVRFLGLRDDVVELYQQCSVLVHPALVDAGPKVVNEAMACGLPVIVADGIGTTRIVSEGENGFVVPSRDSNAIAHYLRFFYNHPSETERMGHNARVTALALGLENHVRQLTDQIYSLAGRA